MASEDEYYEEYDENINQEIYQDQNSTAPDHDKMSDDQFYQARELQNIIGRPYTQDLIK